MTEIRDQIRDHFRAITGELAAQALKAGATGHAATTGSTREAALRSFLTSHIPSSFRIRSGVIVDADGRRTRQQDLVLLDSRLPCIDIGSEDSALMLAESVVATIEVKSHLSTSELRLALDASALTKSLIRQGQQEYRKGPALIISPRAAPIYTYVFAYSGVSLDTLAAEILAFAEARSDPHCLPGAVCVLDAGVVLCPHPMPTVRGSEVRLPAIREPRMCVSHLRRDALFAFYRRLIDDVLPLRLVNYDLDAYYQAESLE